MHHKPSRLTHTLSANPQCQTPFAPFKAQLSLSVNWLSRPDHLMVMPAKQVLSRLSASILCVCVCGSRPDNHSAMPFLNLVEGEHQQGLSSALPFGPINKAAATMAAVLGRPMYSFRLLCILLCYSCCFCSCYCDERGVELDKTPHSACMTS